MIEFTENAGLETKRLQVDHAHITLTDEEWEEVRRELNRRKCVEAHPSSVTRYSRWGRQHPLKVERVVGSIVVPIA